MALRLKQWLPMALCCLPGLAIATLVAASVLFGGARIGVGLGGPLQLGLLALALISPLSLNQEAPRSTDTLASPPGSKQVALQATPLTPAASVAPALSVSTLSATRRAAVPSCAMPMTLPGRDASWVERGRLSPTRSQSIRSRSAPDRVSSSSRPRCDPTGRCSFSTAACSGGRGAASSSRTPPLWRRRCSCSARSCTSRSHSSSPPPPTWRCACPHNARPRWPWARPARRCC